MPNPWLNEHKSMAAMNYFLIETVWPGCDFLPKYTIKSYLLYNVLVKGSIWIIFHKNIQIS